MSLLAYDPNQRYRVAPRKFLRQPEDDQPPTAKTPEKVGVPVPVPVPMPGETSGPPRFTLKPGPFLTSPPQEPSKLGQDVMQRSVMQPIFPSVPPTDTATAPTTPTTPTQQPQQQTTQPTQPVDQQEDIPPSLKWLQQREQELRDAENAPVKKDKWWKSFLKMLAYGAKDMPPAHNWQEFAYGGGRALGAGGAGLIKHDLPGQIQKRYQIAQAEQNVESAQKTAQAESSIANRQSMIEGRQNLADYRAARLPQFQSALDEKKAMDAWRRKTGNDRLSDAQAWQKWRMANGDKTTKRQEDYFAWQQQVEKDRMTQRQTEFDWRKESKAIDQQIARERTSASAQNRDDRFAGDRREADILDQEASRMQNEADDEEDDIIREQKYEAAQRLRVRAQSVRAHIPQQQQSAPPAQQPAAPSTTTAPGKGKKYRVDPRFLK